MKRLFPLLLLTLVMVACGTDGSHFKIEGRLLNLNQGEFYVYSTDGLISGMDTITVRAGRFAYEVECSDQGTLVIVFPNFSEQPVFAQRGKKAEIKGDASHLKEIEVKGTDDNKLMNRFRQQSKNASPAEIRHYAELFVGDHPESLVSRYLINRYFVKTPMPDYNGALRLYRILHKAQPDNGRIMQEMKHIESIANNSKGSKVQPFTAKDINGNIITHKSLAKGTALIYLWASWEYESCNIQRTIKEISDRSNGALHAIGISLDTSVKDCRNVVERDDIANPVVCEQNMFDGKLVRALGMTSIPDNILIRNGKVVDRNLTIQQIRDIQP